jgi:PIN domain nuclease of toxin-antitoxin system
MRVLIDTHVFLWGLTEEARLSPEVRRLLPVADVWISVASIWEMIAKVQVGKLILPSPAGPFLIAKLASNGVSVLTITLDHVLQIESLELHHRDPFDRVLIAQSIQEKLPLVTADPHFERYPVEVIW